MNRKGISAVFIVIAITAAIIFLGGAIWYFVGRGSAAKGTVTSGAAVSTTTVTATLPPAGGGAQASSAYAPATDTLRFYKPVKIGHATGTLATGEASGASIFFSFGDVTAGPYDGSQVVLERYLSNCNSGTCGTQMLLRYVKDGNNLQLLSSDSDPRSITLLSQSDPSAQDPAAALLSDQLHNELLSKLGFSLAGASLGDVFPQLKVPSAVTFENITLGFGSDIFPARGMPSLAKSRFTDRALGAAMTTAGSGNLGNLIAYDINATSSGKPFVCGKTRCATKPLGAYGFYFRAPDHTILAYPYRLAMTVTSSIYRQALNLSGASWSPYFGAPGPSATYVDSMAIYSLAGAPAKSSILGFAGISILPQSVADLGDLEVVGQLGGMAAPIYDFKDKNNPLYKAFYNYYVAYMSGHPSGVSGPPMSYSAFIGADPLLLVRDAFGRMVLFKSLKLLDPGNS